MLWANSSTFLNKIQTFRHQYSYLYSEGSKITFPSHLLAEALMTVCKGLHKNKGGLFAHVLGIGILHWTNLSHFGGEKVPTFWHVHVHFYVCEKEGERPNSIHLTTTVMYHALIFMISLITEKIIIFLNRLWKIPT